MSKKAAEPAALLEEFAEACTEVARGLAPKGHDISWESGKDGFVHFHCPLPGLREKHGWNGGPRASAWVKGGDVLATCAKCVGAKGDHPDQAAYEAARAAYTEQVKRAIRWTQDGVTHAAFKTEIIRSHLYFDRDFKHAIRRDKIRYEDGRKERGNSKPWWWRVASLGADYKPMQFAAMRAELWLSQHYPEHDKLYDALCWYGLDAFIDLAGAGPITAATCPLLATYRVVIAEGEKDADTFNALMEATGHGDIIATCLCHPKPTKLASHHARLIDGRDVVVVGDADEAGRQQGENWTCLVWGHASSVKLVRDQLGMSGREDDKDLTDWIVQRIGMPPGGEDLKAWISKSQLAKKTADELLDLLASTAPLTEPAGRPTEWRTNMVETQKGGIKADSPYNAERVWTMHPDLRGKVHTNLRSGEVEVIDPPWGGGVVVGSHRAALACGTWLERTEKISLSNRVLEDMLSLDFIAPFHNPLEHMLVTVWDGVPRLDGLFTTYVPLKAKPADAVMLARVVMEDLVRKMRNELVGQRLLVGIETGQYLDIAGALMGKHGVQHRGRLGDRQVDQFARSQAMIVQISIEPIANRQAALAGLSHVFAPNAWVVQRIISSPLYIAVGQSPADPRTAAKIDERIFRYDLDGRVRMDDLRDDAAMIIAEAVAQLDGGITTHVPSKEDLRTLDLIELLEGLHVVVRCLWLYITRDLDNIDQNSPRAIERSPQRAEPLRHVVRDQFLERMRAMLFDGYREPVLQERAFNAVCRAFGWGNRLGLTANLAAKLGVDIGGKDKATLSGVLITDERIDQIRHHLFPDGDDSPPPKGGGQNPPDNEPDGFRGFREVSHPTAKPENSSETAVDEGTVSGFLEASPTQESIETKIATPRAYSRVYLKKERGRLDGAEALDAVRAILAQPGACAIDFEAAPGDPKFWGDLAAARAPRGQQGNARQRAVHEAVAGNRAKQRRACTLQLHHEDGQEVFVRLTDPVAELPAMFDGCVATPCAHNAQFEVEVLAKHGVWLDIECTMIAAKCLYLVAVPQDAPQPVSFSLADLVQREFGRIRDKTLRARDWSSEEALDDEAVEYGLQDVRDCLELWRLYSRRLEQEDLLDGYRVMQRSLLPTAAINLTGLVLDAEAHAALIGHMEAEARRLEADLDRICLGAVENHGSSQQVSTWVMEDVLQIPIKPPAEPKLVGLLDFLRAQGGMRPDMGGELVSRDLGKLVSLAGKLSLEDATLAAWEAGYIAVDKSTFGDERPEQDELLAAIDSERFGERVLTVEAGQTWRDYSAQKDHFDRLHKDDPYRLSHFVMRLHAATGGAVKGWRTTKTGHLAITKGSKLRKAEQLAEAFPVVSEYLVKHAQWTKATKLVDAFGPTLRRWQDDDGRVRGQAKVFGAWTGRQACVDPNLTNQPREEEFRALWVASPRRKLVVADYSQIELRLAAIESGDERLREVYREGRDVHAETASIILAIALDEVTKADRQPAKGVNFLSVYGGGAVKLAETIGCSLEHAHMVLARFFAAYPGLAAYRETAPQAAAASGHIEIRPRRRVAYVEGTSSPTQAINAPIQGGAASVQMRALRLVYDDLQSRSGAQGRAGGGLAMANQAFGAERALAVFPWQQSGFDVQLAASVHDEIILESSEADAEEAAALLVACMTRALIEIYPEAEEQGLACLTAATICSRWSEKA